jgi:hypothetical protein
VTHRRGSSTLCAPCSWHENATLRPGPASKASGSQSRPHSEQLRYCLSGSALGPITASALRAGCRTSRDNACPLAYAGALFEGLGGSRTTTTAAAAGTLPSGKSHRSPSSCNTQTRTRNFKKPHNPVFTNRGQGQLTTAVLVEQYDEWAATSRRYLAEASLRALTQPEQLDEGVTRQLNIA